MFDFLKKKKKEINTTKVKTFDNALKIIEDLIYFEDFDKASKGINEILRKENDSFNVYIETINEKNKKSEVEKFKKKISKLYKLQDICKVKKEKFIKERYNKKKKEEIKFIEKKVGEYIGKTDFDSAISVLNNLLSSYVNDDDIISFVNKQKKLINKKIEQDKIKKEKNIKNDAYLQALDLIGEIKSNHNSDNDNKNNNLLKKINHFVFFYSRLKEKLKEKKLLDEVNLLLQVQGEDNEIIAKTKLSQVHSGISKEISGEKINGYDLYGKILGADKISGDSIGFNSIKDKYNFFIGDATGHGIKAGFITSQLTKKFNEISGIYKNGLSKIVMEVNNSLKQDLKSGNFITSIFFTTTSDNPSKISYVGMGHEPMFIYRKSTNSVEKVIPGGLAAGIRIIKDIENIKIKDLLLDDGDILVCYTDGIVEARSPVGDMYSIDRIGEKLLEFGSIEKLSSKDIYKRFLNDLKTFSGGKANYLDDVTLLVLKRDKEKESVNDDKIIDKIIVEQGIEKKYKKNIKGKSFEEIKEEIQKIQKENAIKNILRHLDTLYRTGELPKLKQDCIRYIKEGYIHKKINNYLKEALDKENMFKIRLKEQKMRDKYNILKELYKKGDYETVIMECSNIINKDGNI